MHLLVFFSPLVESFIIFFRQLICRVVRIIPFVFHFSDLHSRSFRSRSFLFQKCKDKPCGDNAAQGAAYYTPNNFVTGHFIKFVGNQIYLPLLCSINRRRKAIRWRHRSQTPNPIETVFFSKPFIGGNAVYKQASYWGLIPVVSHRGKRLNNFTQLMKIDDPKINRSIEQFMEKTVIMNIYVAPDVGKG